MENKKCVACGEEFLEDGPCIGRLCYGCIEKAVIHITKNSKDDSDRGLYEKYRIKRTDGKPLKPGFRFVLSPENDPAALYALRSYANFTRNMELKKDLQQACDNISEFGNFEGIDC